MTSDRGAMIRVSTLLEHLRVSPASGEPYPNQKYRKRSEENAIFGRATYPVV
jgi:hypothetical protein